MLGCFVGLALSGLGHMAVKGELHLFVAPNGSDEWNGLQPAKNRSGGPFASIEHALEVGSRSTASSISIQLRGGTYFLSRTLGITPELVFHPTRIEAFKKESVVLSGGQTIAPWVQTAPGRWQADLPEVREGKWNFSQLFVNGVRKFRPRLPEVGFYEIAAKGGSTVKSGDQGFDQFGFKPGTVNSDWYDLEHVEVLPFHIWAMGRYKVSSIDALSSTVTLQGHTPGKEDWTAFHPGNRFIVENVREALQKPGQWYLDSKLGKLTYLAEPGEDPNQEQIIAPRLDKILEIKGDLEHKKWVENLCFRSISFEHSNWNLGPEGHDPAQAEFDVPAAIELEGARSCRFDQCRIQHTGNYGFSFGAGSKFNVLSKSVLSDLGAGGIKMGETNIPSDSEFVGSNNTVTDCYIVHGGRIHPASIGVWIGESGQNTVVHNEISDFTYTGVSEGWTWGYGASLAQGNQISFNHIHQIGQGLLSDMGGIYTLGSRPTTHLDHNWIHDVDSFSYGGWGIYFDEGSTGVLATNNLVYRTKSAGFHQHYGKDNQVSNNIFAFGGEAQLMRTRAEDHLSFNLAHNIVVADHAPMLGSNWSGTGFQTDFNLFWNLDGSEVKMAGQSWKDWTARGNDPHSVVANPQFIDPKSGNFKFKANEATKAIGFVPFDLNDVGPRWTWSESKIPPSPWFPK